MTVEVIQYYNQFQKMKGKIDADFPAYVKLVKKVVGKQECKHQNEIEEYKRLKKIMAAHNFYCAGIIEQIE